ncbi:MAG TPA: hypothetical protein DCW31_09200 [Lactobacillus sp.]|nr:hypothetical protein [Lactobacillus sp.]
MGNTESENNEQYQTEVNLSIRQRLHHQYSINRQGLMPWLRDQMSIPANAKILELGCGNGSLWDDYLTQLPATIDVTLSDYSQGMVDVVAEKFGRDSRVRCLKIDAQSIPFEAATFDVVIANHTLHTVPDTDLAIREIARVLKPTGIFYTSANGAHGMEQYLHEKIRTVAPTSQLFSDQLSFNLQNGVPQLKAHFNQVTRCDYPDELRITKTQDLIDWIKSTQTDNDGITETLLKQLETKFESIRQQEGAIVIPKQVGLLIARP